MHASELKDWLGLSEMDSKHKLGAELEEECTAILTTYFLYVSEVVWIDGLDEWRHFIYNCSEDYVTEAYEFYKSFLKCMFYNSEFLF